MIIKYKPQGQTLGQLTREVREEINVIGRLDPLASGLVCFLVGEECLTPTEKKNEKSKMCKTHF